MRIGIVGLGKIGTFHANTLFTLPTVDSVVVTDLDATLVQQAVELFASDRVQGVDSVQALLGSGVDGIVIASGTDSHGELIAASVEAGLPTFCEKPLARDGAEAAALVRRLAGSSVPVQVGFQRRYDPGFLAAKDAVDQGELGFLTTIRSTTLDPVPRQPEFVASSGGLFRDCGVHDFDAIRWVSGQEVVEVYAAGSNQGAEFFREYGDYDTSGLMLILDQGTFGLVSNTRYNGRGYDVRLEVHGSTDSVAAGIDVRWPMRLTEPGADFLADEPHNWFLDRFEDAYRAELSVFAQVVAGDRISPCTMADALEATWIAEACMRSVEEHRPVRLDEVRI